MKKTLIIANIIFNVGSASATDTSILDLMRQRAADANSMIEKQYESKEQQEKMQKYLIGTMLLAASYHNRNINNNCQNILIKKCGKEDSKGRIKCLSENRPLIENLKCKNNLDEVYGPEPYKAELQVGDLIIPANSIISFNTYNNKPQSAKLSEDITYRGYTFKKGSSISLRDVSKKHSNPFIISNGQLDYPFSNFNIQYKKPQHNVSVSFNEFGRVLSGNLAEDTEINDILVPADSYLFWMNHSTTPNIRPSKDLNVRGFHFKKGQSIEFNVKDNLVINIGDLTGKHNNTLEFKGITYADAFYINKSGQIVRGTIAKDTIINGVTYPAYTYFEKDSSGKIIKTKQEKIPNPKVKVGDIVTTKEYMIKLSKVTPFIDDMPATHNGKNLNRLESISDLSSTSGYPSEGIEVGGIIKPGTKLKIADIIEYKEDSLMTTITLVLEDDNNELYLHHDYNNDIFAKNFKCRNRCANWKYILDKCSTEHTATKCPVVLKTYLKDDKNNRIFKSTLRKNPNLVIPNEKAAQFMKQDIKKYLDKNSIEYTENIGKGSDMGGIYTNLNLLDLGKIMLINENLNLRGFSYGTKSSSESMYLNNLY